MRVEMSVGDIHVFSEPGVYEVRFCTDGSLFMATRSGSGGGGGMGLTELGAPVFGEAVAVPEPVYHGSMEIRAGMMMKFSIPDIARGGSSALLRGLDGTSAVVALSLVDASSSFCPVDGGDGDAADSFSVHVSNPERVEPIVLSESEKNGWHHDFN